MRNIGFCLAVLLLLPGPAARAQSRVFVSGDVFADARHFSGDAASTLDATTIGSGGGVGVVVNDRWDLRTEVGMGATTTVMRPLVPSIAAFQLRTRTRITATSLLVGFYPVFRPRVRLTVLGGMSFLRVRTQLDSIPSGLVVAPGTRIDNVAGPVIGAEIPIRLFWRISVVPEVRAHAFTLERGAGRLRYQTRSRDPVGHVGCPLALPPLPHSLLPTGCWWLRLEERACRRPRSCQGEYSRRCRGRCPASDPQSPPRRLC